MLGFMPASLIFRDWFDRCADHLRPHLGLDLRASFTRIETTAAWAASQLNRTSITQPALFSLEYSLAQWWMAHGVRPQAMLGHSIGEYVAACLADVLSLEDALEITAVRGRLMDKCEAGAMLAVVALAARDSGFGKTSRLRRSTHPGNALFQGGWTRSSDWNAH